MCTMWTWTWIGFHVHKTKITQVPIWNPWKFHNDKQMFSNLLFNSFISKEEKNAIYFTLKLHFF
jgi:hypothetical protein